jgi:hypothetical protein
MTGYYSGVALNGWVASSLNGKCINLSDITSYKMFISFTSANTSGCASNPGFGAGVAYSCTYTDKNGVSVTFNNNNTLIVSGCKPCDSSNYTGMTIDCTTTDAGCQVNCDSP